MYVNLIIKLYLEPSVVFFMGSYAFQAQHSVEFTFNFNIVKDHVKIVEDIRLGLIDWYGRLHTVLHVLHVAGILCRIAEFHIGTYECHHVIFHAVEILAEHAIEFCVEIHLERPWNFRQNFIHKRYSNVKQKTCGMIHAGFDIGPCKHLFHSNFQLCTTFLCVQMVFDN